MGLDRQSTKSRRQLTTPVSTTHQTEPRSSSPAPLCAEMTSSTDAYDAKTQAINCIAAPPENDKEADAALEGCTGLDAVMLATEDAASPSGMHAGSLSSSPLGHRLVMTDHATKLPPTQEPASVPSPPKPRHSLLLGGVVDVVDVVAKDVSRFYRIFGGLGIPMLVLFLLSAAWTFMLAVIQVYTTEVANSLMGTASFDNGNFWLLPKPHSALVGFSVALLVLFGLGYVALAVLMLFFSCRGTSTARHELPTKPGISADKVAPVNHNDKATIVKLRSRGTGRAVLEFVRKLATVTGEKREYMVTCLIAALRTARPRERSER